MQELKKAAEIIRQSRHTVAFCGAGISVESGIPPFRGEGGLWSRYDPEVLDLDLYLQHPEKTWKTIKEIFYDFFGEAKPNPAHYALAELERLGFLKAVITQNIDNLHQAAGSKEVIEFHGNSHSFVCQRCGKSYSLSELVLSSEPPGCPDCSGLLKPDFIFFGEAIPQEAIERSFAHSELADALLIIGTTGEIMPASMIPRLFRQRGAKVVEINPGYSAYQNSITHIHIAEPAGEVMPRLVREIIGD